jgi:hypothetical protein
MVYQMYYMSRNSYILNYESWVMRTVLIGSVVGIVFACALRGMSEIAQPALAISPKVSTKSGAGACTPCSGTTGKPFALAPPGLTNPLSNPFASSGYILCGGKPGTFTKNSGLTCTP